MSYGDYVEQLTYLVFLKMADEQASLHLGDGFTIPKGYDWKSLVSKDGDELEIHYRHILETLAKEKEIETNLDLIYSDLIKERIENGNQLKIKMNFDDSLKNYEYALEITDKIYNSRKRTNETKKINQF